MALKIFVKVSGVSNLSDARYSAGMGVNILGFSFDPADKHFVPSDQYIAITEWISGVDYAAEFNACTPEEIEQQLTDHGQVDLLQVTDYHQLPLLQKLQLPIILKIDIGDLKDIAALADILRDAQPHVKYFLLENEHGQNSNAWLDDVLRLSDQYPILLGFGIDTENIAVIADQSNLQGIALKGSEEIKPGYKSYDELADILEALEVDDLA